ncbi:hypothetical protein O181_053488 [Austropuccinia psidii MF-1]|uniref:Mediator of RNA polymerase II transcription subunit 31 n=1 Tax=Austropuccinia psidii MF-1 TaxID=1389203 RepID=A0A9Q3HQG1_9BASI|nr:hypothetical protein [Austropuccinia psidii MF-1]
MIASDSQTNHTTKDEEDEKLKKAKEANQARFEEDLEFVQSLANPHFVQELTLNDTLRSETMINYLNYLKYFHDPDYARFVRYPNALKILDLLNTSEKFRTMIETQETAQLLTDKFIQNWISLSGRLNKTKATMSKEATLNGNHASLTENASTTVIPPEPESANGNSP